MQVDSLPAKPQGKHKKTQQSGVSLMEWVSIPSPADLPDPGLKPVSPTLHVDSLPAELSRKQTQNRYGTFYIYI